MFFQQADCTMSRRAHRSHAIEKHGSMHDAAMPQQQPLADTRSKYSVYCNLLMEIVSHLSAARPVFDATTPLSSARVVPSSRPRSLAEDAPDPHVIFRLRGIVHGSSSAATQAEAATRKEMCRTVRPEGAPTIDMDVPPSWGAESKFLCVWINRHSR